MARILITGYCAYPGPNRAGVQLGHVVSALSRHHTVDVLVLRRGDQAYVERKGGNCRILRVPLADGDPRAQIEAFRRALRRQLESSEYDVVHMRDGWSGVPVLEMRARLEYAAVFDAARAPMADFALLDLDLGAELAQAEQACLVGADMVLVPGDAARSHVARDPGERVQVVPPGVDVNLFDWDEPAPGPPVVLYAGTIEPGRGVRVLLRAMVYVLEQVDARLVLAGAVEPEFRKTIKNGIKELGLVGRVELAGEIDHADMPALIAGATVCVAPAAADLRTQPGALYPTKLLEYMACRRAVVAPRRSSTAALLSEGRHGVLFEPGDPVDLAGKIAALLGDGDTRERLADAGYQLVRQGHAASATRRALRRAYRYVLGRVRASTESDRVAAGHGTAGAITPSEGQPPVASDSVQAALADTAELADRTDEYAVPFPDREVAGDAPGDAGALGPVDLGEITAVELRPGLPAEDMGWSEPAPGGAGSAGHAVPAGEEPAAGGGDAWVVAELDSHTGEHQVDQDGTPVDGTPVPPAPVSENRFVAGELEVPDRPRDIERELEEDASFTAVGVLLGGLNDDTDGAGRGEPG